MLAQVEIQRREQNLRTTEVEAQIARTRAEGEAEAIRLRGEAEGAAIRARAEALRSNADLVQLQAVEKWDGKLPTTMVPSTALPFIDLQPGESQPSSSPTWRFHRRAVRARGRGVIFPSSAETYGGDTDADATRVFGFDGEGRSGLGVAAGAVRAGRRGHDAADPEDRRASADRRPRQLGDVQPSRRRRRHRSDSAPCSPRCSSTAAPCSTRRRATARRRKSPRRPSTSSACAIACSGRRSSTSRAAARAQIPARARAQVETSFARLGRDKIDLIQVHNVADMATQFPILEEYKQAGPRALHRHDDDVQAAVRDSSSS